VAVASGSPGEPIPEGQVALPEALAGSLAEDLHHPGRDECGTCDERVESEPLLEQTLLRREFLAKHFQLGAIQIRDCPEGHAPIRPMQDLVASL
jgi:hypothetical protein